MTEPPNTVQVDIQTALKIGQARQQTHSDHTTKRFYQNQNQENIVGVLLRSLPDRLK